MPRTPLPNRGQHAVCMQIVGPYGQHQCALEVDHAGAHHCVCGEEFWQ